MLTREFENKKTFEGYSIFENRDSLLAIARKEIILPTEKKIVLLDEANETERNIISSITKGGIVL